MIRGTLTVAGTLALCAIAWLAAESALTVRAWRSVPDAVLSLTSEHLTSLQGVADGRLASVEAKADAQMSAARRDILARLDTLVDRMDVRAGDLIARADARTGEAIGRADARLGEVTSQTGRTLAAAETSLNSTRRLTAAWEPWLDCGGPGEGEGKDCLQRKVWWMTLKADSALTEVAKAAPLVSESVQASTLSAQQAAASAAMTSQNLAALTKPGPKWLRYVGLGVTIAAPASQVALPFVVQR